jgi:hypothetical protein
MQVENVHERWIQAPVEDIQPWLERIWSGEPGDVFPRDRLSSWRQRADGKAEPWRENATKFGHANLRFRLRQWDGRRWEAEVLSPVFRGWHGFDLEPRDGGTHVRHTLAGTVHGSLRVTWPLAVRPLHDWALEALLDRLDDAARTGREP